MKLRFNKTKYRGQASAIDALVAFVIFALTFALFLNFQQQENAIGSSAYPPTFLQVQKISYLLAYSQGIPADWNATNMLQLGFADSPGIMDSNKISYLNSLSYSQIKESLGASNYDLSIQLYYPNGTIIEQYQPVIPFNPNYLTPVFTPVVYQGEPAILRVYLWQ